MREGPSLDQSYNRFSKPEIRGGKFQILMSLLGVQRLLWGWVVRAPELPAFPGT